MTAADDICYIGLDIGTSAVKGVLADAAGAVLAEAAADCRLLTPLDGYIEFEAEQHYQNVCQVIRDLAAVVRVGQRVVAVAISGAAGNTLLTDPDGKPLMNIISWMDQRAELQPPALLADLTPAQLSQITGWPCTRSFPLAQLAWLREYRRDLFTSAGHYGMDTDWLVYCLSGRWVMDHSTATTFHLQDQVAGDYYKPFLRMLGIPPEKLSTLARSGVAVGPLTAAACRDTGLSAQTAVITGCFDHPSAARAVGVVDPGQLMLSCGTSWVGFVPCADRQAILDAGMLCDPFLSADGGPWGGIFSVPHIGRAIDWYIHHVIAPDQRDPIRVFNESAAEAESGAGGLVIDLRQPPTPIAGDRRNVSRAVMEGAARLINQKIRDLRERGFRYDRAIMVGGPAHSPVWPRIVAEITGLSITVGGRSAGARGAALLAAQGVNRGLKEGQA